MLKRLRAQRFQRYYDRALRTGGAVGLTCATAVALAGVVAHHLSYGDFFHDGWALCMLGAGLILAGARLALTGESPTMRDYVKGETDSMPGVARLLNGILAAVGGVICFSVGMMQLLQKE